LLHALILNALHALFQFGGAPLRDLTHRREGGFNEFILRLNLRLRFALAAEQTVESIVLHWPQVLWVVFSPNGVQEFSPLAFAHVLRLDAQPRILDDVVKVRPKSVIRMVWVVRVDELLNLARWIERGRVLRLLLLLLRRVQTDLLRRLRRQRARRRRTKQTARCRRTGRWNESCRRGGRAERV